MGIFCILALESEIVSKSTYKAIDLLFLLAISAGLEALILFAYNSFGYGDGYIVSFVVVIGLIAIYRWNFIGIIVPILSGVVTIMMMSINKTLTLGTILAYTVGYLPMLVNMLWFKFNNKVEMSSNYSKMFAYYITGYLLVDIGRTICIVIGTADFSQIGNVLYTYVVWDLLNVVIGALVYLLALRQKVIVYDMKTYLLDLKKETATSMVRKDIEDYNSLESMAENDEVSDIALLDGGTLTNDQLKEMNDTYNKMTHTETKYVKEQKAIKEYKEKKSKKEETTK